MNQNSAQKLIKNDNIRNNKLNRDTLISINHKKAKYKRRERLAICVSLIWVAILGCLTISSSTDLNIAQNKLQNISSEIVSLSTKNSNAKQEVSELSSRKRLTQIAKKDGLSWNEQNTRNVTK